MTWKNHRILTFAMVYAVTGYLAGAVISMLASTLPDRLEMGIIPHRTYTHWVLPALGLLYACHKWTLAHPGIQAQIAFYLLLGYCAHLLQDSFSKSGIPFIFPRKTYGANFYITRRMSETLVVIVALGGLGLYCQQKGYLDKNYLKKEAEEIQIVMEDIYYFATKNR
ncbi:MAG: metal-dependent hydrolase [Trichlorobacter sp.]|nr:metal-dependent hydrolase [Trichlorobacter sp.]